MFYLNKKNTLLHVARLLLLSSWILLIPQSVAADSTVAISGRVYNLTSGEGYADVPVYLCGDNGYAYTDAQGNWTANIAQDQSYCARVIGGVPETLKGLAIHHNSALGGVSTYEYQKAGRACLEDTTCSPQEQLWDKGSDTGLDFAFDSPEAIAAALTPPSATPTATPAPQESLFSLNSLPKGWINYVLVIVLVLAGTGTILASNARQRNKQSYREYLRNKYYNL